MGRGAALSRPSRPVRPPGPRKPFKTLALLAILAILAPPSARAAAASPAAKPGPCQSLVDAIKPGAADPVPFLAAGACMRNLDSAAGEGARRPVDTVAAAALKRLLPAEGIWYVTQLDRLEARRDIPRSLDMAYLAALKDPPGPEVWKQLAEAYSMAGDAFASLRASLRQAERDSNQAGYLQYQIDNQLRSQAGEVPAAVLLDSVTAVYKHTRPVTAEMLEYLCWSNRDYACAYRNTISLLSLRDIGPPAVLEKGGRFHSMGYWDYAAGVLDKAGWRKFPKSWLAMSRAFYLRIRYPMQDWAAIAAELPSYPKQAPTEEEDFILATALIRLGRIPEGLARLGRFETLGESPWGYRAQLLKAQALIAQGRSGEAARLLDALKKSPLRKEASGPILFWQGWLALQQGHSAAAESLLVLASAYTGSEESQRALEFRFLMLLDSGQARSAFFKGVGESPLPPAERLRSLDQVEESSPLWPYARIEKAQILRGLGQTDSARAVLDDASRRSQDRQAGFKAEAMAAYLQEKTPEGRQAALVRYEDLLIKYQQGVIPEFSRGRIKALK